MAEIQVNAKKGNRKTAPPRIDLTPMVDLGFLLITFFMFTTTMAKAKTIEINMPSTEHTDNPTAFIAESTLTIIAAGKHLFYCYEGAPNDNYPMKKVGISGLREVIINKKNNAYRLPLTYSKEAHKLHVLIKPSSACVYDDVVAMLDEMAISAIPYYAITEVTPYEQQWMNTVK